MDEPRHRRPFTVTIEFKASPADQEELMDLVTTMIMEIGPYLASQEGFMGFRSHRSLDGTSIMNYLQWATLGDHERVMSSPEMESAGGPLMEWVDSGRAAVVSNIWEMVSLIDCPS